MNSFDRPLRAFEVVQEESPKPESGPGECPRPRDRQTRSAAFVMRPMSCNWARWLDNLALLFANGRFHFLFRALTDVPTPNLLYPSL